MFKIKYKIIEDEKYKYELLEEYLQPTEILIGTMKRYIDKASIESKYLKIDADGNLTIKRGYCWDGASGPTIDCESSMRASLVHDAIYQLIRDRLVKKGYRRYADELFHTLLIVDGMNRFRAFYYYLAVRLFGGGAI